jgi:hypothetical protein
MRAVDRLRFWRSPLAQEDTKHHHHADLKELLAEHDLVASDQPSNILLYG